MRVSISQLAQLTDAWLQIEEAKARGPLAMIRGLGALAIALDTVVCSGPIGWLRKRPSRMEPGEFIRFCADLLPRLRNANASLANLAIDVDYFSSVVDQITKMDRANA